ncbi:MAG: RnfABCDGE type electron transport complex subunit D [Gammaproteobacteria bacterium]
MIDANTANAESSRVTHSPFLHSGYNSERWSQQQMVALLPGALLSLWFFGPGVAINIAITVVLGLLTARALNGMARQTSKGADTNLIIMAIVLGLAIPPGASILIPVVGTVVMVALGKQLWGGTGQYPFHPAMVAYLALLLLFSDQMLAWPEANGLLQFDWSTLANKVLLPNPVPLVDGLSQATPLLDLQAQLDSSAPQDLLAATSNLNTATGNLNTATGTFYTAAGLPMLLINLGFLSGGLYLCYTRAIAWQAPVAALASILFCCLLSTGFLSLPGELLGLHLFAGHLLLVTFWVTTELSSSAKTARGRLLFGVIFGCVVYFIRQSGAVPDGLASAIIIANLAAPLLDHRSRVASATAAAQAAAEDT